MISSGTKANRQGHVLEASVVSAFTSYGKYTVVHYKEYIKNPEAYPYALIKHYPFESIYLTKCYSEFMLIDPKRKIRIECKWQQVRGSVDEKFPYLVECIKKHQNRTIILHGGQGARKESIAWMESQAKLIDGGLLIDVKGMDSFIIWVNNLHE